MDTDFSRLWQHHLSALRDDFSRASVEALPSQPSRPRSADSPAHGADGGEDHAWDVKNSQIVDGLDDLTLQSPNTTESHSPKPPWLVDREGYTETAISSPQTSSWPRTVKSSNYYPGITYGVTSEPSTSEPRSTGKRLARLQSPRPPIILQKQHELLYEHTTGRYNTLAAGDPDPITATADRTAASTTTLHTHRADTPVTQSTPKKTPAASEVRVLILTWAKQPDRRGEDGQLLSPSFNSLSDTETLRACFKRRGYRVQCRLIPADYPTAAVETILGRFLEDGDVDKEDGEGEGVLLVIYYHGWGCLDGEGRMMFLRDPDPSAGIFFWDDVRGPIMQSTSDVLLVFDCTGLPGARAEQHEIMRSIGTSASMASSLSTKQLLGVCVPAPFSDDTPPASTFPCDAMTQSLCRTLDRTGDRSDLSVQRLCSLMREDLRGTELATRVFVTQLGGGQLLDVFLSPMRASASQGLRQSITSR